MRHTARLAITKFFSVTLSGRARTNSARLTPDCWETQLRSLKTSDDWGYHALWNDVRLAALATAIVLVCLLVYEWVFG